MAPATSYRAAPVALLSLTKRAASTAATIAIGTLTNRHQRQEKYWVRTPPSSRPTAAPPPEIAPYTPNARARSFGSWNVTVSSDSAAGASSAAKAPWSARAAKSMVSVAARPPMADATAKPSRPTMKIFLRPT